MIFRTRLLKKDALSSYIGFMLVLLAALTGIAKFTETYSRIQEDSAGTQIILIASDHARTLALGQFQAEFAWGEAYALWLETDTQAALAALRGDQAEAQRYLAVRDQLQTLSPLLNSPYYDPDQDYTPNIEAFESDLYVVERISGRKTRQYDARARVLARSEIRLRDGDAHLRHVWDFVRVDHHHHHRGTGAALDDWGSFHHEFRRDSFFLDALFF